MAHLGTPLEAAIDHGVEVSLLGSFGRSGLRRRSIDGFMEDRIVRVVLLHCAQVVGALEEVLALARGVFRSHGLAVNALRGETLGDCSNISIILSGRYDAGWEQLCYVTAR